MSRAPLSGMWELGSDTGAVDEENEDIYEVLPGTSMWWPRTPTHTHDTNTQLHEHTHHLQILFTGNIYVMITSSCVICVAECLAYCTLVLNQATLMAVSNLIWLLQRSTASRFSICWLKICFLWPCHGFSVEKQLCCWKRELRSSKCSVIERPIS